MEAINRLKIELLEDLVDCPTTKEDLGRIGKIQGRVQSCDEIYGLEVFRHLDQRGEDEQANESNTLS